MFEIKYSDLAGRIGILHTNHGKIETPSFVPVIHPVKQSIPAKKIKEMGFDVVITNAYITMKRLEDKARENGIHKIIKYDGSIMTDSGGYQVLEYGEVDVKPPAMAKFEMDIMTDFAIPLDKPTGFGLSKKQAREYVDHTLRVCKTTINNKKNNGWTYLCNYKNNISNIKMDINLFYKFIKNKPEKYTWYSIDRPNSEFIPSFTKKIFKKIDKFYK